MKSLISAALSLCVATTATAADWPQFRGPDQQSIANDSQPPLKFGKEENVAWKAPLPGRGVSSPIVVGGRAIVTATSWPKQDRLYVLAFDEKSGKELWRREFWATGRWFTHPTGANAAPSPASDGKRIFAFFSSNDLACLDLDGNLLWYRGLSYDYPSAANDIGMSSSPVVIDGAVIVQLENMGDSFAAGLNDETGEDLWRIDRKAFSCWTSPTLFRANNRNLVLLQSTDRLSAHDPQNGKKIWEYEAECAGIPSSTSADGKIYLPSKGLTKLDVNASANAPVVAWEVTQLGPGNATPIVQGDKVYTVARAGVLSCAAIDSGEVLWKQRMPGTFWATPVIAGKHLFAANQDGQVHVVALGDKPELVSTNDLGEGILGSPAVAGNALYLRSDAHLWKIAAP